MNYALTIESPDPKELILILNEINKVEASKKPVNVQDIFDVLSWETWFLFDVLRSNGNKMSQSELLNYENNNSNPFDLNLIN